MAAANPTKPETKNGGIPFLCLLWLLCAGGAVLCYYFLPPSGESESSPQYGLNRVIVILSLVGAAILDALLTAVRTFKRRRQLTAATKSLGYSPFFFTSGSIGALLQRLFAE